MWTLHSNSSRYVLFCTRSYLGCVTFCYFPAKVAENGSKDIQLDAYHHLRKLGFRFYDTQQTGQVMATFTSDTPIGQLKGFVRSPVTIS